MGEQRSLIQATVVGVNDASFLYPCCIQCYAKMLHNVHSHVWQCVRCNQTRGVSDLRWRYRLSLCVADSSSTANLSLFGGTLLQHFGCDADTFHQFISGSHGNGGFLEEDVMVQAVCTALVGRSYIFCVKTPNGQSSARDAATSYSLKTHSAAQDVAASQPLKASHGIPRPACLADLLSAPPTSQRHDGKLSDLVAVQMIPTNTQDAERVTVMDVLQQLVHGSSMVDGGCMAPGSSRPCVSVSGNISAETGFSSVEVPQITGRRNRASKVNRNHHRKSCTRRSTKRRQTCPSSFQKGNDRYTPADGTLLCSQSLCSESSCSQLPCSQSLCSQSSRSQLLCSQSMCSQSMCSQSPRSGWSALHTSKLSGASQGSTMFSCQSSMDGEFASGRSVTCIGSRSQGTTFQCHESQREELHASCGTKRASHKEELHLSCDRNRGSQREERHDSSGNTSVYPGFSEAGPSLTVSDNKENTPQRTKGSQIKSRSQFCLESGCDKNMSAKMSLELDRGESPVNKNSMLSDKDSLLTDITLPATGAPDLPQLTQFPFLDSREVFVCQGSESQPNATQPSLNLSFNRHQTASFSDSLNDSSLLLAACDINEDVSGPGDCSRQHQTGSLMLPEGENLDTPMFSRVISAKMFTTDSGKHDGIHSPAVHKHFKAGVVMQNKGRVSFDTDSVIDMPYSEDLSQFLSVMTVGTATAQETCREHLDRVIQVPDARSLHAGQVAEEKSPRKDKYSYKENVVSVSNNSLMRSTETSPNTSTAETYCVAGRKSTRQEKSYRQASSASVVHPEKSTSSSSGSVHPEKTTSFSSSGSVHKRTTSSLRSVHKRTTSILGSVHPEKSTSSSSGSVHQEKSAGFSSGSVHPEKTTSLSSSGSVHSEKSTSSNSGMVHSQEGSSSGYGSARNSTNPQEGEEVANLSSEDLFDLENGTLSSSFLDEVFSVEHTHDRSSSHISNNKHLSVRVTGSQSPVSVSVEKSSHLANQSSPNILGPHPVRDLARSVSIRHPTDSVSVKHPPVSVLVRHPPVSVSVRHPPVSVLSVKKSSHLAERSSPNGLDPHRQAPKSVGQSLLDMPHSEDLDIFLDNLTDPESTPRSVFESPQGCPCLSVCAKCIEVNNTKGKEVINTKTAQGESPRLKASETKQHTACECKHAISRIDSTFSAQTLPVGSLFDVKSHNKNLSKSSQGCREATRTSPVQEKSSESVDALVLHQGDETEQCDTDSLMIVAESFMDSSADLFGSQSQSVAAVLDNSEFEERSGSSVFAGTTFHAHRAQTATICQQNETRFCGSGDVDASPPAASGADNVFASVRGRKHRQSQGTPEGHQRKKVRFSRRSQIHSVRDIDVRLENYGIPKATTKLTRRTPVHVRRRSCLRLPLTTISNAQTRDPLTLISSIQSRDSLAPISSAQSRDSLAPISSAQSRDSLAPISSAQSRDSLAPISSVQTTDSLAPSPILSVQTRTSLAPISSTQTQSRDYLAPISSGLTRDSLAPISSAQTRDSLAPILSAQTKDSLALISSVQSRRSLAPISSAQTRDPLAPSPILSVQTRTSLAPISSSQTQSRDYLAPISSGLTRDSLAPISSGLTRDSLAPILSAQTKDSLAPISSVQSRRSLAPISSAQTRDPLASSPILSVQTRDSLAPISSAQTRDSFAPISNIESTDPLIQMQIQGNRCSLSNRNSQKLSTLTRLSDQAIGPTVKAVPVVLGAWRSFCSTPVGPHKHLLDWCESSGSQDLFSPCTLQDCEEAAQYQDQPNALPVHADAIHKELFPQPQSKILPVHSGGENLELLVSPASEGYRSMAINKELFPRPQPNTLPHSAQENVRLSVSSVSDGYRSVSLFDDSDVLFEESENMPETKESVPLYHAVSTPPSLQTVMWRRESRTDRHSATENPVTVSLTPLTRPRLSYASFLASPDLFSP
ncbi:hypothetical protein V1264_004172 [Littorina saxatilis]|uniref:Replication factor A C-terminal domain-containing protein n=1 Tax=Littorina saxatilis TaxID=31220 RepID=A0AAN9B1H8_9CAEN